MKPSPFFRLLKESLGHIPTPKQAVALEKLTVFITGEKKKRLFLLKGYAGTGKTTIIGALVKNLPRVKKTAVLAAPTGRAAKVITNYSGLPAQTIHRKIYYPKKNRGGNIQFVLQKNKHRNTVFIVDEASMIPDLPSNSKLFENGSLLDDLMEYVYSGENCQLILIGDTAQLPPVGSELSPALDPEKLELKFNVRVDGIELDEVVRQQEKSEILHNATLIRRDLNQGFYDTFKFEVSADSDVIRLKDGYEIMDAINEAHGNAGHEETAFIVRSNKRANLYNQQIRNRILFRESELEPGDFLMVVKNNYFWLKPSSEAGFVANGDIVEILEIFSFKELYGFRFAEVKLRMVDYPNMRPFETVLMLDVLQVDGPSLAYEDSDRLYREVIKDYEDETSNYKKFLGVKNNKYFNALQVKFGYAITCHKSQGGQWDTVFVEQPYLPNGMDRDYLRWLYTACTRAKKKLYLIGFSDDFFKG
jgi:exodeoxyribonuclease-5